VIQTTPSARSITTPRPRTPVAVLAHGASVNATAGPRSRRGLRLPAPRGYQRQAEKAIMAELVQGGRGQVIAACGTGKTLVAARAAARLCPNGLVVLTCPSLTLLAQTLKVWAAGGLATQVLAVCSDETVGDAAVRVVDLPCPTTTDPAEVTAWVRRTAKSGLRLILSTHVSAGVAGRGIAAARQIADLLIVDEAHMTAGRVDKHVAVIHHDTTLPARARLYLTATPRIMRARRIAGTNASEDEAVVSMDDPAIFGPVLYSYPFRQAIADGWLDDYRIAVIGVRNADVLALLRRANPDGVLDGLGAPLRTTVVQAALAQAVREFGLRRVVVFTNRIDGSRAFVHSLATTIGALPPRRRPTGTLTAVHVDGTQVVGERERHLAVLADPPGDGWTVVSNARCLTVGVDVPAVDAVVFAEPKSSGIDVVQAVGRALRRNPEGSGVATILIPVLLPDTPGEVTDSDLSDWATVWQVVRAMRAHDTVFAGELDHRRAYDPTGATGVPPRLELRLPPGYTTDTLLRHITVRLLDHTTTSWPAAHAALTEFHRAHGHLRVPAGTVVAGINLPDWLSHQRKLHRTGRLPTDIVSALNELNMGWNPKQTLWDRNLDAATAFHRREGHLDIPKQHIEAGITVGDWLNKARSDYHSGVLTPDRVRDLTDLGVEWEPRAAAGRRGFDALRAFYSREGHLRIPKGHRENGLNIRSVLDRARQRHKNGTLTPAETRRLKSLGPAWQPRPDTWTRGITAARTFHAREGHLRPPNRHREGDIVLHEWLRSQRAKHAQGTLTADRARALRRLGEPLATTPAAGTSGRSFVGHTRA
jgi:superfamily II DNA or RNA helicase